MLRRIAALGALGLVMTIGAVAPASAQATAVCAREGGFCSVPYPTTVIYSYRNNSTSREVGPGGIPCNNNQFGDPAPGVGKTCRYVVRGERRFREREERGERYERRRRDNY